MKKSYLALGLVAAVAMSSCSNDEPLVNGNGNQSDLTKGLQPVVLSMTTTSADVNVGTRGTGTVGSTDAENNNWQFEDIYVLMTSSDTTSLEAEDFTVDGVKQAEGWGFTSVRGKGPFLLQQFNGTFWARPYVKSEDNGAKTWGLDYSIDENEWWDGAAIDKFYPMTGKSNFFAFYVDDACSKVIQNPYAGTEGAPNVQAFTHDHPVYAKDSEKGVMTIDFAIDGSQDLMFGTTNNIDKTYQGLGFSAQSARAGIIPSITMDHLLSRLVFNVIKGAESTDMVQLDKIEVLSESTGTMVVAYKDKANFVGQDGKPANILAWTEDQEKVAFELMEKKPAEQTVMVDGEGYLVQEDGSTRIQYELPVYGANPEFETNPDAPQYVPAGTALREILYAGLNSDGTIKLAYDDGRPYMYPSSILPSTPEYTSILALIQYETVELTINDPKPFLQPLTPIALKDLIPVKGDKKQVGEAMFVKPQADAYKMNVCMTMTIREAWTETLADGSTKEHVALTEEVVLPLDLVVKDAQGNEVPFEAGKSYNVNVTIYGLEKVEVEVVLNAWVEGGDINVGQDEEYPTTPSEPTPGEDDENEPGENEDDENN